MGYVDDEIERLTIGGAGILSTAGAGIPFAELRSGLKYMPATQVIAINIMTESPTTHPPSVRSLRSIEA